MARYSFTVYGSGAKYGQLENNRAYYNVNLRAISYDYQSVFITWTSLLSDPTDVAAGFAPTHWKLLRSKSGASDSPYEGEVISSGLIGNYALNAVDTTVDPDTQTIYSFWIFNGREWINCGTTFIVSVANTVYPTLRKIEKWLPAAWLNETYGIGDAFGEPEPNDLTNVLSAYAFFYDKIRVETDLLEQSVVYKKTPVQLLKNKLIDRGFTYEPTLGDAYHRGVYRASETINAKKGTSSAIESYVTALTHWGCKVESGINLLLNYNDSSFEETIGNWGTSAGTLHAHKYATSLADVGVAVTAPSSLQGLVTFNTNNTFAPRTLGFLQLAGNNTTATTVSLPANGLDKVKYGIPVKENKTYIFTGWVRVKEANKEAIVKVKISWYNLNGTLISTTSDGTPLTASTTFAKFSSLSSTSPEGTKYASITITVTNAHITAQTFFDMLQFAENTGVYEYQDARKVLVYVEGDKTDLIRNASFETNTDYWTALNGTLTTATTPSAAKVFGNKFGKLTVTSPGTAGIVSEWMPVDPSENYTASAYVSGTAGKTAVLRLEYSQLQSVEDQTRVLSDEAGAYYPIDFYYIDSEPITLTSTPQRLEAFAIAPVLTTDAGSPSAKVSIYMPNAEAGNLLYVDSCQLEDGTEATTYFDGTGAPAPTNPIEDEYIPSYECFWENETTQTGRSYRWNNYYTKLQRLAEGLPLVMPYGVSWEIRSGYSTPEYPELTPNILTSPSFERNTNGWNGTSATISRTVTRGSLFDEYTTHGIAFAKVTSTASSAFSIYSNDAVLENTGGYYTSVALKPENEDAYGNYVLSVRYLDNDNVLVVEKQASMLISNKDRWAYMAAYVRKYEIAGATKAVVRVTCTPNTPGSGIVFYIDRVVFRQ